MKPLLRRAADTPEPATADVQSLLTTTDIAAIFLDRDCRLVRFTAKVAELFDVRDSDKGKPIAELRHQLGYDELADDADEVIRSGRSIERQVSDPLDRWYLARLRPHSQDDQAIAGVAIAFIDITALRRAREEPRDSQEPYRLLLESASQYAIFMINRQGRVRTWNRGAELLFGYSAEEVLGRPFEIFFTAEDRDAGVPSKVLRLAESGEAAPMDRWQVRRDGSRFWASGTTETVYGGSGEKRGYMRILRDNTDSRRAQQELVESEARFRSVANAAPMMVWVSDADRRRSYVNAGWLRFTGRQAADELGDGWLAGVHPDDRDLYLAVYRGEADPPRPFEIEFRLRRKDGTYRWVLDRADPRFAADGSFAGYVGSCLDVHDMRESQEALRRLNQALEKRVESRTSEVKRRDQRVLELAARLAKAERVERHRIAQLLHDDLQQLLYGIEIKIETMQRRARNRHLSDVEQDLGELSQWVLQSVALTRRLTVDLSPPLLHSARLIDMLEWIVQHARDLHGVETTMELDIADLFVPDEDLRVLLFQGIRELLFNIKKHAGTDHAAMRVLAGDDTLIVRIQDRGAGFDAERQAEAGGFGITDLRERLRAFDGTLELRSRPGRGTTSEITLPLRFLTTDRPEQD